MATKSKPASYIVKTWKERDEQEEGGRGERGKEERKRDRKKEEERNEEIWRMDGGEEERNKG